MIRRRQWTVFLNLDVITVSSAKPLIKKKEATAIKTEGEELVIFLSGRWKGKRSMVVVASFATTMALCGIKKNCSRKDIIEASAFEANAKNNFPHITFPTETTHCCGTKHPSLPGSHSLHIPPERSAASSTAQLETDESKNLLLASQEPQKELYSRKAWIL